MTTDTRDPLVPDPEEPPPPTDEPVAEEVLSVPREGLESGINAAQEIHDNP